VVWLDRPWDSTSIAICFEIFYCTFEFLQWFGKFRREFKIYRIFNDGCPNLDLSIHTTFRPIQSGETVPLNDFTLSVSPGMFFCEDMSRLLFQLLESGYRMECPPGCPNKVYRYNISQSFCIFFSVSDPISFFPGFGSECSGNFGSRSVSKSVCRSRKDYFRIRLRIRLFRLFRFRMHFRIRVKINFVKEHKIKKVLHIIQKCLELDCCTVFTNF